MKLCAVTALLGLALAGSLPAAEARPADERVRLSPDRPSVPIRRLSSGALRLLDRAGELVTPPAAPAKPPGDAMRDVAAALVTLDPRVGPNIRLGDDPPALPATRRAQAEPHIVRYQNDPDFLVATFQEGRYATGGGAVDCGYSISRDGGLTWTRALIPGLTQSSGGAYFRATDPVAGMNLAGHIFLNTIGAVDSGFNIGAIVLSRSTDGGLTFGAPTLIYQLADTSLIPDKNWLAINTFSGTQATGRMVVTFTLFSATASPIVRSYSDNGGVTWSPVASIHPADTNAQGSQPVFLPDGRLAIVYWNFGPNGAPDEHLEVVLSGDGGVTFGAPVRIANAVESIEPSIRTGAFLPAATTDRSVGHLYVVYTALNGGAPRVMFTKSTNAGATWSAPIVISDNPTTAGVFNPAVAVSPDGQNLSVSFYDRRMNPGSTTLVDLFLAQSFDGGATWQPNLRLSSMSTDAALAPLTSQGYMLGDYLGMAPSTGVNVPAVPVWVDTRTGNPDPFITRVGVSPLANFTSWQAARLSLAQINNPLLGGMAGDADGDGEDNLSEFRSGTDPVDPASVVHSARPINLSTRLPTQTGENVLIGGFVITGTEPKRVIVRAVGPSLTALNVPGALADPTLELHDQSQNGAQIAFNDNWRDTQQSEIQASGFPPSDDRESAIVRTLAPGAYTAIVRGSGSTTGVSLVEVYDLATGSNSQLVNLSTRGLVGTINNVMIGGFVVGAGLGSNATGTVKVLVRAVGPSLANFGIAGALQDPILSLYDVNGVELVTNDNWRDTQQAAIQATGFAPADDREPAILVTLPKGPFTAIVRGKNLTTGVALVEVYAVP